MPKNPDLIDQVRGYEFWREGCATLLSNTCEMLTLAGMDVGPDTIIRLVGSIEMFLDDLKTPGNKPDCYCDKCFRAAFDLTQGCDSRKRYAELFEYFCVYLNDKAWVARTMLVDSVIGVVSCFEHLTPK